MHLTSHLKSLPCSHIVVVCDSSFDWRWEFFLTSFDNNKNILKKYIGNVFSTISHHTIDCVCTTAATQTGSHCVSYRGLLRINKKKTSKLDLFLNCWLWSLSCKYFGSWSMENFQWLCALLKWLLIKKKPKRKWKWFRYKFRIRT